MKVMPVFVVFIVSSVCLPLSGFARLSQEVLASSAGEHISRGETSLLQEDWDGALAEFRKALAIDPHNTRAHMRIGTALAAKGDWDAVADEMRAVIRLSPDNADAHWKLGMA